MSSQVLSKANAALNASKSQLKDRIRDFSVPATRTASTPVITTPVQSSSSNKRAWTETVTTRGVGTVAVASTDVGLQKNRYSASSATSSLSGKLYQIIDHLKRIDKALTAAELKEQLRIDIFADRQLYDLVINNAKIAYADGSYAYKPIYSIRTKKDLSDLVREHWANGQGGLHVRDLKEGWKTTGKFVEELVAENEFLALRAKDGKPLVIFYNDRPRILVKEFIEFKDLWMHFTIPDDVEMQRELSAAGLSLLEVQESKTGKDDLVNGRKKRKARHIKITNTHLKDIDLSVDYPMKKRG